MTLTQGAIWRIVHRQIRNSVVVFKPKIQHAHNMRVDKLRNSARLFAKVLCAINRQLRLEDFYRRLRAKMDMLAQIHLGETTLSNRRMNAIIAKLPPGIILHHALYSRYNPVVGTPFMASVELRYR